MDIQQTAAAVNALIQASIDAYFVYAQASTSAEHPLLKIAMTEFQTEQEHHITKLSALVTEMGETPTDFSRDFKGFVLSGLTAMIGLGSDHRILQAMQTNASIISKLYETADDALPNDVKKQIKHNQEDVRIQTNYINSCIDNINQKKDFVAYDRAEMAKISE